MARKKYNLILIGMIITCIFFIMFTTAARVKRYRQTAKTVYENGNARDLNEKYTYKINTLYGYINMSVCVCVHRYLMGE